MAIYSLLAVLIIKAMVVSTLLCLYWKKCKRIINRKGKIPENSKEPDYLEPIKRPNNGLQKNKGIVKDPDDNEEHNYEEVGKFPAPSDQKQNYDDVNGSNVNEEHKYEEIDKFQISKNKEDHCYTNIKGSKDTEEHKYEEMDKFHLPKNNQQKLYDDIKDSKDSDEPKYEEVDKLYLL